MPQGNGPENNGGALRHITEGMGHIVGLIIMGVVYPNKPNLLAAAPYHFAVIDQHGDTGLLEIRRHLYTIMISQDAEDAVSESQPGNKRPELTQTGGMGAIGLHADIAADETEIRLHTLQRVNDPAGYFRQAVKVEIGEQQDPITVKGSRQMSQQAFLFST